MSSAQSTHLLQALLRAHGVESVVEKDWLVPDGVLPAIRALWYPNGENGQLDVQALVRDGVLIEESFSGLGKGETGLQDAFASFSANSLHVLLAALWDKNDPEQVTTESWKVGSRRYTAFIGNFGTRSSVSATPHVPHGLFSALTTAIRQESLGSDMHWLRVFVGNFRGDITYEALLDNAPWEAGLTCLRSFQWQETQGYYSIRLFAVLSAA